MSWQNVGGPLSREEDEVRCGTVRPAMNTNPLMTKAKLGKVKGVLFNNPPPDHVFGFTLPPPDEGAREVTMMWKDHKPSSGRSGPKTDFKTMNKLAVTSGVSTAKDTRGFREAHHLTLKEGVKHRKPSALPLPSEKDSTFTYGKPSGYRTAEVSRICGPTEPPLKRIVQGAYQDDWIRMNESRGSGGTGVDPNKKQWVQPELTKASLGHSIGANRYMHQHNDQELWKMSKFKTVDPKVTEFMGKSAPQYQDYEEE